MDTTATRDPPLRRGAGEGVGSLSGDADRASSTATSRSGRAPQNGRRRCGYVPGIKGATATNQLKPATLGNRGGSCRLPPFIGKVVIRATPETGEIGASLAARATK